MEVARKSFTATGAEDRRWQGLVLASSMAGLVQHAAGEFVSAGENVGAGEGEAGVLRVCNPGLRVLLARGPAVACSGLGCLRACGGGCACARSCKAIACMG